MKFLYDLTGSKEIIKNFPIYGAGAAINAGAVIMRGATSGTNQGFGIVGASTLPGVLGVLQQAHALVSAGLDSKADGTAYTFRKVSINPFGVFRAERAAGTVAVASVSSLTVTITSLEASIQGGWFLGNDGQLQYIVATGSGTADTKSATGWTSANTVTRIAPQGFATDRVNTAADKLDLQAAAGTAKVRIIENWIKATGLPLQTLDPTKHSGLTLTSPVTYSDILFTDHAFGING